MFGIASKTTWKGEEGLADNRTRNLECENPAKNLGCDLGIDAQKYKQKAELQ
jgi:hypothetical protein